MKKIFQKYNKFSEYLLYLLVLILPFQTRWIIKPAQLNGGYFEYETISLYVVDVLLILLTGMIIYSRFFLDKKIKKTKSNLLWLLIGGIEMMVFISLLLSSNFIFSLFIYARFLLALSLFWILSNFEYVRKKLLIILIISMTVQSILGIFQFQSGISPACTYTGMASHTSEDPGASVVEVEGKRFLRAYGSFDHPNIFGGFLTLGLLIIFLHLLQRNKPKTNQLATLFKKLLPENNQKTTSYIICYMLRVTCYVLCVTALFFTFSRASWIAFASGLLTILFLSIIRRDLKIQKIILQNILIVGIIFYSLFIPYQDLVITRFSQAERIEIKSTDERMNHFAEAKTVIKNNWLFGVGIGNYSNYISEEIDNKKEVWQYQPVHNVFMLIWAEIGLIGLIFFIGILQVIFSHIIKKRKKKNSLSVYKLGILVALLVLMMFDHWLWSLHFGVFWFWFVLGLL
ncbi:O-antigen ligase family protein [Candidatus Parcubacteria bacterium]|nr:O-antigen ligase family protein [Candidatus Parcubacteria bacterium]